MQYPNMNRTDQAAGDFFHSSTFKILLIIFGALFGIPCLIGGCLLFAFIFGGVIPTISMIIALLRQMGIDAENWKNLPQPPP